MLVPCTASGFSVYKDLYNRGLASDTTTAESLHSVGSFGCHLDATSISEAHDESVSETRKTTDRIKMIIRSCTALATTLRGRDRGLLLQPPPG